MKQNYNITKDKRRISADKLLQYNGSDCGIDIQNTLIPTGTDFSISVVYNRVETESNFTHFFDTRDGVTGFIFTYDTFTERFYAGFDPFTVFVSPSSLLKTGLNSIVGVYNSSTENFTITVNSVHAGTQNIGTVLESTGGRLLQTDPFLAITQPRGGFGHIAVFNKKLSEQEINYIYQKNALPESSHEACTFHMPFNQQPYQVTGTNFINDVVANYNYAKSGTNFTGNHGEMIGWTDEELGITESTAGFSHNTAFRNFYNKSRRGIKGLDMGTVWGKGTNSLFQYFNPPLPVLTSGWSVTYEADYTQTGADISGSVRCFWFTTDANGIVIVTPDRSRMCTTASVSLYNLSGQIYEEINSITITSNTSNEMKMYLNGILVDTNNETFSVPNRLLFGVTGNGRYYARHDGLYVFDNVLTDNEVLTAYTNNSWMDETPQRAYTSEFAVDGKLKDITGNGFDINPATNRTEGFNLNDVIDSNGFQTRKYGLTFNSASSQYLEVENFVPTKEEGYTVICAVAQKTDTSFPSFEMIFSKFESVTKFYEIRGDSGDKFYGVINPYESNVISRNLDGFEDSDLRNPLFIVNRLKGDDPLLETYSPNTASTDVSVNGKRFPADINTSLVTTVGFDEISGGLVIGGRSPGGSSFSCNGHIVYLAVFKGVLNDHEIKELYNNGNFANPSTTLREKYELVLYPDFNNPYDDGGTLKIPDLSDSNHTIIAEGWANIGALETARIEISSLL